MAVTFQYRVDEQYTSYTQWAGTLEIRLTNRGLAVEGPLKVSFILPREVVPSTTSTFEVENSGVITTQVTGTLQQGIGENETAIFTVNVTSPTGTLSNEDLPLVYFVNDSQVFELPEAQ